MVQGIASEIVAGVESVLCLLGCHHDLVKGEGVLMKRHHDPVHILSYIDHD